MAYEVFRSPAVRRDLDLVYDHLFQSYISFGDSAAEAFERAQKRIQQIRSDMDGLALVPHQGTGDDDIRRGLRHVTRHGAITYFLVDDAAKVVLVVAVFFGGQDHRRHMLKRLR